ncbi:MAG: TRAP transporter large permease [bacterium]
MNAGLMLIILMLVLSLLGVPIGFALGVASIVPMLLSGMPLMVIPQKMFVGMDSIPLLAIGFFMLAGNLMAGGINTKIINLSNALFGWVKGSLAAITVVASAIFASISGSGVATVAAIGGTTIPAMIKEGYPGPFAAAVASFSAILGPLIPPSVFLIVYGASTETSIGKLFMAAFIPGIMLVFCILAYSLIYARVNNFPSYEPMPPKQILGVVLDSGWACFMPILILGGIFFGIVTTTEAANISAVYALVVSVCVYKDIKVKDLPKIFSDSALSTCTVMILLAFAKPASWIIVRSKLPNVVLDFFMNVTSSPWVMLFMINILLLIVGMIMEGNCAIVMLAPLLLPLIKAMGMDPIHFGVIMALNLCIGLVTPPVGSCLLLGNTIADQPLEQTLKQILPLIAIGLCVLALVTYVPAFSLWLPSLAK